MPRGMTPDLKNQFATQLLQRLGAPNSEGNIAFLRAWMDMEGCAADNNPMATTGRYGQNVTSDFNHAGVRNFATMQDGVEAQARTLMNGHYPTLLQGLRSGNPWDAANGVAETRTYTGSSSYFGNICTRASQYLKDPSLKDAAQNAGRNASDGGPAGMTPQGVSQKTIVDVAPGDVDAQRNFTVPLSADVSQATPISPVQVIQEGLDLALWWQKDPTQAGGLIQNPHLRGVACPAWFELRLNKVDGTSLSGKDGKPLQIRLNASLQSLNTKMQHIISREPTATGLMISMWGSQPDTIVGRGTTGAFINQFGLTALMSNRLTAKSADWYDLITMAITDQVTRQKLLGDGDAQNLFRVAAQDAFAELLALFKNNGVTRFLPRAWADSYIGRAKTGVSYDYTTRKQLESMTDRSAAGGMQVWSPAAGATGFQMLARAGDIYTRGHVVFKYKGKSYLGYFKSFNFTASADTPFRWDFDFTFRVLKSFDPMFVSASNG